MLITRHADVAQSVSMQRAFGIDRNVVSQRKTPGDYDVERLGFNYRLNEIGAAIGLAQMQRVEGFLAKRHENDRLLRERLGEIDEVELLGFERVPASRAAIIACRFCSKEPLAARRLDVMESLGKRGRGLQRVLSAAHPAHELLSKEIRLQRGLLPGRRPHQQSFHRLADRPPRRAEDIALSPNRSSRRLLR